MSIMMYLLAPLHRHFDRGFGAMADAYVAGAAALEDGEWTDKRLNGHLPIAFLRRHAVELYLKSAIVIFHRHLHLPYGPASWDGPPKVLLGKGWEPFYKVHSVADLFRYYMMLFEQHSDFLANNTRTNWSFTPELPVWIDMIQKWDPDSTLSRYPTTKDGVHDYTKGSAIELDPNDILAQMEAGGKPVKAVVVGDAEDNVLATYTHVDNPMSNLNSALRQACSELSDTHAALRGELTAGW